MKNHRLLYLIVLGISVLLSCIILFLGYISSRLPEAFIIVGGILIIVISIFLFSIYFSRQEDVCKIAYAGRQYVKAKCLCKHRNQMSMIELLLCKNGVLIQGESLNTGIMEYKNIVIGRISKFCVQLIYHARGRKLTYDITFNNLLEIKAVLQAFSNQCVYLSFDYDT